MVWKVITIPQCVKLALQGLALGIVFALFKENWSKLVSRREMVYLKV